MMELMSPVVEFINELDRERDVDDNFYETILSQAKPRDIESINTVQMFTFTPRTAQKVEKLTRISYTRLASEVEDVKESLGVKSNAEVGNATFEYYLKYELGE